MTQEKLCIVDRFEGNYAVIEYGKETFNIPKSLLPNINEGDVLNFNVSVNELETELRKKKVEALTKKLFNKGK